MSRQRWRMDDAAVREALLANGFTVEDAKPDLPKPGVIAIYTNLEQYKGWYETDCPIEFNGWYVLADGRKVVSHGTILRLEES